MQLKLYLKKIRCYNKQTPGIIFYFEAKSFRFLILIDLFNLKNNLGLL